MNNYIVMTILFILVVWAGLGFWWTCMISQETREKILLKLHTLRKKKKEEKDDKKEEETPKDSSSSSVLRSASSGLGKIIGLVIGILLILLTLFIVSIGYEIIAGIFSSGTEVSEIQEKSWKYCQKSDPYANEECSWGGNVYKVKKFINTNERTSFEVHWGLGHGVFTSNAGSSESGTYRNFITGEEGEFKDFRETEKGFSSRMTCLKNCNVERYSFTIEKR